MIRRSYTKTEYREYLSSEKWQERRRKFLEESGGGSAICEHCEIPRWLAVIVYDQDLHVHHKSYAHRGAELDEELQALCRRCHEIVTFGESSLQAPQRFNCERCLIGYTWNRFDRTCDNCDYDFMFKQGQFDIFHFKWYSRNKNWGRIVVRRLIKKIESLVQ